MTFTTIDASLIPSASQNVNNIIDNGGMDIWQRGTSFTTPASGAYTADRWFMLTDGAPTFTVAREGSIIDSVGKYSFKLNITALGAAIAIQVRQLVENYWDYSGKTVTLSARVRSNVAGTQIRLDDGVTSSYSNTHSGGSTFETLTVTKTFSSTPSAFQITLNNATAAISTIYFASVMVTVSPSFIAFVPTNPEVALARCQRYFQVFGGETASQSYALAGFQSESTSHANGFWSFPVTMRAAPTMTVNNATNFQLQHTGTVTNLTSATSLGYPHGAYIQVAVSGLTAGEGGILLTNALNATIYASADL